MPSLFERCDGCSGYGHISDPWNFGAQFCADCWRRLQAHRAMMADCKRAGRCIAFSLGMVAVRAASEPCLEAGHGHQCGHSFDCTRASLVLERAGLWRENGKVI